MKLRGLLPPTLALLAGACAGSKDAVRGGDDAFFSLPFTGAPARVLDDWAPRGDAEAYTLQVVLERADLSRLAAPSVTAFKGQAASISMLSRVPYRTGDGDADAEAESGLKLTCVMTPAAGGEVAVAFVVSLSRVEGDDAAPAAGGVAVKPRMPDVERVEVAGARSLAPGVTGLLARVPSPDGSGPMLVLARVVPSSSVGRPDAGPTARSGDAALARPLSGPTRHLRLAASRVDRDLEPGTVLDESATPDLLKASGGAVLRDFEIFSCLDARVRVAGLLETVDGARGLVATCRDDGTLDLAWTTTGATYRASVRPAAGRRYVALARIEGGGTAGVLVSVDAD